MKNLYALLVQKGSNFAERLLQLLVFQRKGELTVEKNIKYSDTKHSICDYYYQHSQEKKPIFIYIHGGGFICGVKEMRKPYCYEYARKGFFVMNTHYDYAPQKKYPYQIHQLFKAIENLLDNSEKYNLDTSKIVIGGESAGAYFASYISCISKNKELYDKLGINFKYRNSFDIKACILLNGACDQQKLATIKFPNMKTFLKSFFDMTPEEILNEENREKCYYYSPMNFIDKNFPPSVVVEGSHDSLASESQNLVMKFTENEVKHISILASGIIGLHGFCLATKTKEGKRILDLTQDFVSEVISH